MSHDAHPVADLWDEVALGQLRLPHRLAMSPMTRNRATPDGVPTALNAEYYRQRASTALIISEGVQPSADGQGYMLTPGIYTAAQIEGWRGVTDAVHEAGGRIFIQLMHVGRIAHPANTPHGRQPVAPSEVRPSGEIFTPDGLQAYPEPHALSTAEVEHVVGEYRHAAACAIAAGADGVEIHGANGYLVHQFLSANANLRSDRYGGSVGNRIRFAVEVAGAVADEIGAQRTGIRISPGNPFNDISEPDARELYGALVPALAELELAYLHLTHTGSDDFDRAIRQAWPSVLLLNRPGAEIAVRAADLTGGLADMIAVGTLNLANPDLVARLRAGATLNEPDATAFYGGGAKGYTDYPTLLASGIAP